MFRMVEYMQNIQKPSTCWSLYSVYDKYFNHSHTNTPFTYLSKILIFFQALIMMNKIQSKKTGKIGIPCHVVEKLDDPDPPIDR